MTKPTMQPAGAVDAPPRGQDGSERPGSCAACRRNRAMRDSLFCLFCASLLEGDPRTPEAP